MAMPAELGKPVMSISLPKSGPRVDGRIVATKTNVRLSASERTRNTKVGLASEDGPVNAVTTKGIVAPAPVTAVRLPDPTLLPGQAAIALAVDRFCIEAKLHVASPLGSNEMSSSKWTITRWGGSGYEY